MEKNYFSFEPKSNLGNACTIYETIDPVYSLSYEIKGIEFEKQSKLAFFKTSSQKTHEVNFLNFINNKVAEDLAQGLAKTWCPYLLWVLRNFPYNFEKIARHEICEKNTWARRHVAIGLKQKR